jgi:perosamine synthetase
MSKLALLGGEKIRSKPFSSRPHIDGKEREYVQRCLDEKLFSRFIGSPVANFREQLALTSAEAGARTDFWSVIGGPFVRNFEAEFARRHAVKFAVSSNSATSSITSAMIAAGIKPGDEVITTPFSFTATAAAQRIAGAKLVFADIDPETFCISAESVARRIGPRTRAVVPVHLLGNAGDIVAIQELCASKGLILIEDSAQAVLSRKNGHYLGTFGKAGLFSFQETKNMMTGEGGMAITDDPEMAYRMRLVRNHGEAMVFDGVDSPERIEAAVGYNYRMPEIVAALGLAQIEKIELLQGTRRANHEILAAGFREFPFLRPMRITNDPGEYTPYCVGLTVHLEGVHRNTVAEALRAEGIPVATGFPRLMNENPFTREDTSYTPVAKRVNEGEYLGFFQVGYPNTAEDMQDILRALRKIRDGHEELRGADKDYRVKREYNSGRL